ncbi:MAG: hypothetical protein KDK54_17530 [Leptospiraceae bacterium]|nr:hypothetical protein [Leptospiraceae bacterium]
MPLVGEIFFDKGFVFSDGDVGQKLFVVIYANPSLDLYLVLKTTSQQKRYPTVNSIGCHSKKLVYFLPSTIYKSLDRDTFIQLGEIFSYIPILRNNCVFLFTVCSHFIADLIMNA